MVDACRQMRRRSSTADRFRTSPNADAMATTTALAPNPDTPRRQGGETTPPAARSPAGASPGPRPSRSDSGACRSTNRLTLTLPIAPRTSDRSRPAPMMAAPSSIPPTPVETPTVPLPADASEFIIAIAAQERRVLELREELSRAEADLASLKRQWAAKKPLFQPGAAHQADAHGSSDRRASDDGAVDLRRSVEIDRKKLLLQGQNHGTPTQGNRRRVLRGGHARALSLLSPARPGSESHSLGPADSTTAQPANPVVLKRASWQAQSAQSSPSVPQIVEDFKLGLRAFVEDIRQVTVGDEPVSGQSGKATARGPGRPATGLAPGGSHSNTATPMPASRFAAPVLERPKPVKSKPFSWTPLGFESMEDGEWSNWESPAPTKSPRWSDSTINSAGLEEIEPIPEMREDSVTPVKRQPAKAGALSLAPKLEEIMPSVVNRLSPSNLKRAAHNLMDGWEKSLVGPAAGDQENGAPES